MRDLADPTPFRALLLVVGFFSLVEPIFAVNSPPEAPEELKRQLLAEAPRQWTEYRNWCERLQGTVISRGRVVGEKEYAHDRLEYRSNTDCRLCIIQPLLNDSAPGHVYGYNRRYAFSLVRGRADRPWAVRAVIDRREGVDKPIVKDVQELLQALRILVCAHTVDLPDLVRQPHFQVRNVSPAETLGAALVRVDFDNSHPVEQSSIDTCPIQDGSLVLDPAHFWCLRSTELHVQYPGQDGRMKVTFEVLDPASRYPIPKRETTIIDQVRANGLRLTVETSREYELREPGHEPADSEFTLEAFRFPEPPSEAAARPRWFLWLSLAGFAFLALGVIITWLWRRGGTEPAHV